jgi:hypothetical protein
MASIEKGMDRLEKFVRSLWSVKIKSWFKRTFRWGNGITYPDRALNHKWLSRHTS